MPICTKCKIDKNILEFPFCARKGAYEEKCRRCRHTKERAGEVGRLREWDALTSDATIRRKKTNRKKKYD